MSILIETREIDDYTIRIYQDTDADWEDEDPSTGVYLAVKTRRLARMPAGEPTFEETANRVATSKWAAFSVDLYEHGGMMLSLSGGGIQCRFDTSRGVGYVLVEKAAGWGRQEDEADGDLYLRVAQSKLDEANAYLSGRVYGFTVEREFEEVASCWGFVDVSDDGTYGGALTEAEAHVEADQKDRAEQAVAAAKARQAAVDVALQKYGGGDVVRTRVTLAALMKMRKLCEAEAMMAACDIYDILQYLELLPGMALDPDETPA